MRRQPPRPARGAGAGRPPNRRRDPPGRRADTGSALDAVDPNVQMQVDLRNLVRSQDELPGAPRGLLPADGAVRPAVPLAPRSRHHDPERGRRLLVGHGHSRPPAGEELRHLVRARVPEAGDTEARSACRTSRARRVATTRTRAAAPP